MITILDAVPPVSLSLDGIFNTTVSGGVLALLFWTIRLFLNKRVSSRSDDRADRESIQQALNNTIKILADEKQTDLNRLKEREQRIHALETEADKDYDRLRELRKDVIELTDRLAHKDRNIALLAAELVRFGAIIDGLDSESIMTKVTITYPNPGSGDAAAAGQAA